MTSIISVNFILSIFENNYMPHGACYFWDPVTLWSNVIGDAVTSISYFMIPGLLVYFVNRRKDVEVNSLLLAFAIFIVACGSVHFLAIINVWNPFYDISGVLKVIMAIVSVSTVFMLWKSMPELLKIPSPRQLQLANEKISSLNSGLEDKIRARTSELEEMNKELESFSYSISHDLQIPIRAILGYASIMKEDHSEQLNEEGIRKLETISESALKMNNLVQGILEFSRLGKKELNKVKVNMELLFQDVFNEVKEAQNVSQEIHFTLKKLPGINGDRALLKQLVTNILSNSIKYSTSSDPIKIEVYAEKSGKKVTYFVKDNGIGFNEEYKSKMFEVFHRLHDDNIADGTGVGLAIANRIVEKHDGSIDASSDGNGAIIQFSLPK